MTISNKGAGGFFPGVPHITYEGPKVRTPFAFRHYNADEVVAGKTMAEHLRFAVCYWHTFTFTGRDPFGLPTMVRSFHAASDPMAAAEGTLRAAFELFGKLGVKFWTFHDRDIAPEGASWRETTTNLDRIVALAAELQQETGIRPLWGTANLFSHPRYAGGAATSSDPRIFATALAQVQLAMEASKRLGAVGYVFWGGREGYETLLNTDLRRETDNLARFLHLCADYARSIGLEGDLYIEPKPREPSKHQYDFDAQSVHGFLIRHGLDGRFKLNIEANHATLAGHEFAHELEYCAANGLLGSVDANRGDELLGWDTDQFPTNLYETTKAMLAIRRAGGFTNGGLNFDAKVRRQSTAPEDLFHAHIGAMDAFARGLKIAARIEADGVLEGMRRERYAGWQTPLGQQMAGGAIDWKAIRSGAEEWSRTLPPSGRQELLENILNDYV